MRLTLLAKSTMRSPSFRLIFPSPMSSLVQRRTTTGTISCWQSSAIPCLSIAKSLCPHIPAARQKMMAERSKKPENISGTGGEMRMGTATFCAVIAICGFFLPFACVNGADAQGKRFRGWEQRIYQTTRCNRWPILFLTSGRRGFTVSPGVWAESRKAAHSC